MLKIDARSFRKTDIAGRRQLIQEALAQDFPAPAGPPANYQLGLAFSNGDPRVVAMAEALVENAYGVFPLALGLATGFVIDGLACNLPLATEEPSVIAAASLGATIISRAGGFRTWACPPRMTGQIFVEFPTPAVKSDPVVAILAAEQQLCASVQPLLASMEQRGGGWRGMDAVWLPTSAVDNTNPILRVQFHLDTCDAMGANLINTCAETLRSPVETITGGRILMAILSNAAPGRLAGASCAIPVANLGRDGVSGPEMARRMVVATRVADADPDRAITHNKGIMNGISALALATANDSRAIEAAAHVWAGRTGRYCSLSRWWIEADKLCGSLELPLPFATVGGALGFHPVSNLNLVLAGVDSAVDLSRRAAALGLAQNFAALQALVGAGIQAGHMKLHARRLAWKTSLTASPTLEDQP